jgi:hypothetical protein
MVILIVMVNCFHVYPRFSIDSTLGISVSISVHIIFLLICSPASGSLRCEINNGGCWKKTQDGTTFSACVVSLEFDGTPLSFCFLAYIFDMIISFVTFCDSLFIGSLTSFRKIVHKVASVLQDSRVME